MEKGLELVRGLMEIDDLMKSLESNETCYQCKHDKCRNGGTFPEICAECCHWYADKFEKNQESKK